MRCRRKGAGGSTLRPSFITRPLGKARCAGFRRGHAASQETPSSPPKRFARFCEVGGAGGPPFQDERRCGARRQPFSTPPSRRKAKVLDLPGGVLGSGCGCRKAAQCVRSKVRETLQAHYLTVENVPHEGPRRAAPHLARQPEATGPVVVPPAMAGIKGAALWLPSIE